MTGSAVRDTEPSAAEITFDDGLLGFADAHRFTLLRTEDPGLFWLQSLDHDPLAFLLLDPFAFFEEYTVDLDEADAAAIGASNPGEIAVLAIVTLPTGPDEPFTANLTGPLAINLATGRGRQIIVKDNEHGVRAVVDLARRKAAT